MLGEIFWFCIGVIVYTYFGYPALLFLLAKTRAKPKPYLQATPAVTLLILAYNEEAVIARKLENSLELDYPADQLQILVVTDGSDDNTVKIVTRYIPRGIELTHDPVRRGKMAAINRAWPYARGTIILFSDANNLYEPKALRELVRPFTDPTVGGVTGAKTIIRGDGVLGDSEGLYWRYESLIRSEESRLGCCTGTNGEIFAMRRALFVPPPSKIINDDFYLAMQFIRRGYRLVYVPEARSYERVSASAQGEIERRTRIIAGRYQAIVMAHRFLPLRRPLVVWQIVSHKFLRPLVPFAMLGALVTNVLTVLEPAPAESLVKHLSPAVNWLFLGGQLLFYGLALLGNRGKGRGKLGKLLYLPTFLVHSNWAALAGLYRFLMRHQSALWTRLPRHEEDKF